MLLPAATPPDRRWGETPAATTGSRALAPAGWTPTLAIAALCTLAGLLARLHRIGNKPFWLLSKPSSTS